MKRTAIVCIALLLCVLFSGSAFSYTDVQGTVSVDTVGSVTSIAGSNPCVNPTATLTSITSATTGTFAAQLIAASGTKKIYICSMTVLGVSGTNPTFSLVYGTGANCAVGQGTLVQAFGTTAGSMYTFANPVAVTAASQAVCYVDGGTTPVQNYQMTYIQQ